MIDLSEIEIEAVSGGDGELKEFAHRLGKGVADWLQEAFERASHYENVYVG